MRCRATGLFLGCCLAVGCGTAARPAPAGTNVAFTVADQRESRVCDQVVTPGSTCTVTMTARVVIGELEGKEWHLVSLESVVRDGRSGQDLHAAPGAVTSEEIGRLAGGSVVPAHGHLAIPLELRFVVGQAPFYVDGPHELDVKVSAVVQ